MSSARTLAPAAGRSETSCYYSSRASRSRRRLPVIVVASVVMASGIGRLSGRFAPSALLPQTFTHAATFGRKDASKGSKVRRFSQMAADFQKMELEVGGKARVAAEERGLGEAWQKSADILVEACDVDTNLADAWIAKAFGWTIWINAGRPKYLEPRLVPPEPDAMKECLEWLSGGPLQLSPPEMKHVITTSPRTTLRAPEKHYEESKATAPEKVVNDFRSTVVADPKVLELTYDCAGACKARCSQCWKPTRYR
eukprot:TRINITY_DN118016_c0_g1_i1.p1 TRINITY_DN118016_c0_g1~~TRINITY_DN118016_c0_g1_i1.p1  ORF type:complete len:285 (-),score=46.42 TRINITY_DN118016_c0_g1_i1:2-763(-)